MPFRILIVDDSPLLRRALGAYIQQMTDWQVCGEAEDGRDAVEKVGKLRPDVVILDLQMPIMNGLEAAREVSRLYPNVSMVMATMYSNDRLEIDAREAGISFVFSKSTQAPEDLISAVRNVLPPTISKAAQTPS